MLFQRERWRHAGSRSWPRSLARDGRCSRLRHLGRRQPPVHGGGTRLLEGLDVALPGHDRPLDDLPDRRRFRPGHHRRHVLQPAANVAGRPHGDPPEVLRPRDRSRFQLYPRAYRRLGLLDGRIHLLRPGGHRILRHSRRGEGWHLSGAERDSGDQSRNQDHGFAVVVPQMDEGHGRRPLETLRFVDRRASQSRLLRRLRRVFRAVGDRDGGERIPDLRHHDAERAAEQGQFDVALHAVGGPAGLRQETRPGIPQGGHRHQDPLLRPQLQLR